METITITINSMEELREAYINLTRNNKVRAFTGFYTKRKILVNVTDSKGKDLIMAYLIPSKFYYSEFLKCLRDYTR